MRGPLSLLISLVLLAGATACGADDEKKDPAGKGKGQETTATQPGTATAATTATTARPSEPPKCRKVAAPRPKPQRRLPRPTLRLDPKRTYEAVLDTSCGQFTIALDVKESPKTSASFVYLARRGYFDGTTFHRVVPGFVIQGGDPQGTGQGGPGYEVVEAPPPGTRYVKGVVAMAKTEIDEPGTSGSQFYVVTGEDAQLPPDYAVLGRVTAGQDVVDLIGSLPTDQSNADPSRRESPVNPVVIRAVRIDERR
ncbi:MAG TPA: peptidylprolyl isomerase [Solirubrobacteraceae bacterium]|nr:peptidylprolyl isomerase [Solirubrobacteraceae bacterium]